METADVVVIGGGCMGASVLFHLCLAGAHKAVLLEADVLGAGSTSKAAGGIRVQYSDELNTRIALRSLAEFAAFEELTGADIDFRQNGYLFVLNGEQHLGMFRAASALQQRLGIPSEELTLDEASQFVPPMSLDGLVGAFYSPWGGVATPEAVVQGYASAARRLGGRVLTHRRVLAIETEGDRVVGVRTEAGRIATGTVVLAAGVWSAPLAATVGLDLPVHGERRWIHYSDSDAGLSDGSPLTVDFGTGLYFHRERRGLIFGGPEDNLEDLSHTAVSRLPVLAEMPITRSWHGLYDMSPDHNAMLGAAPVDGLFYATGFSGHGFMQSPAVGEHLAELVLRQPTALDLSALAVERFADGGARAEEFVI